MRWRTAHMPAISSRALRDKVGGGGGGRPNMAQAGGKNPAGIPDAIAEAKTVLEAQLA